MSCFFLEAHLQAGNDSLFARVVTSGSERLIYLLDSMMFFCEKKSRIIKINLSFGFDPHFSFFPRCTMKVFLIMVCKVLCIRKMKHSRNLLKGPLWVSVQ